MKIDFQEAAEELRADYIVRALCVYEGREWKMERTPSGVMAFYVLIDAEWCVHHPPFGVYFVKWEPVRGR